jgi:(S)-mandelate dehydrogenase
MQLSGIDMNIKKAVNINDLKELTKKRLPKIAYDFLENGAEDELCYNRNLTSFADYKLLPRYLVDITKRTQETKLFDKVYSSPFGFAPTGTAGLFKRGAEEMLASISKKRNIPYIMSGAANASIEDIARVSSDNTWYQIYATLDREIAYDQIRRAKISGFEALVITVDVPIRTKRERNIRNGFSNSQRMKPSIFLEALTHPGWIFEYLRNGGPPTMGSWVKYVKDSPTLDKTVKIFTKNVPATNQIWEDIKKYRDLWPRKLIIKGILHPKDALKALEYGVDGIILSNHGGRQLDRAPTPIDVLPEISKLVGRKIEVMIDGGVRRGSDIIIAQCLGAKFVFIGRAGLYGAAAGGLEGIEKACQILSEEIDQNLGQIGCPDISDLGEKWLFNK